MIPAHKLENTAKFRLLFILWCILLIACRETDYLVHPRFWAEEGKIFFSFALHHSTWENFTTPLVGYLTFFNSIISSIQKIFSLESAPAISTYSGFLVQLIPIYIILFTTHPFWNTPLKKILISLTIILVTPPELWLNTTNSHFIFGLITFLILVVPAKQLSAKQKWFFRILLLLGNLTGPASMLFTPLFFIQAYFEKSREKYIQSIIQTIFALLQAGIVIYSLLYQNQYHRLEHCEFATTINNFFIDHFSLNVILLSIIDRRNTGILIALYFVYLFIKKIKQRDYLPFLIGFFLCSIFSTAGSLKMEGSPRYGYITTCILLILIITHAIELLGERKKAGFIISTLAVLALTLNAVYYKSRMEEIYTPEFPVWKQELSKWRADPTYKPKIHPVYPPDTWYVDLPADKAP
jgi:hypothetical protein